MKNKDEKICSIPKDLWELILKNDYVGDILDIVEMGGAEELKTFLKKILKKGQTCLIQLYQQQKILTEFRSILNM